jgi:hypothetical protein
MSELHLDSLEIRNFRCFEHLVIEKLGRINLIVGKNSVGKTGLLEAMRIYAGRGNSNTIFEILGYRDEIGYSALMSDPRRQADPFALDEADTLDSAIKYLFTGRHYELGDTFSIGSKQKSEKKLSIGISLFSEEKTELGKKLVGPLSPDESVEREELIPRIVVNINGSYRHSMPLYLEGRRFTSRRIENDDSIIHQIIPVNGLDIRATATLWERVSLTDLEAEIVKTLSKVVPDISGINLVGFSEHSPSRTPFLIAKTRNTAPAPLKSFGDGLQRAFGICLALVNSRNGFLLIDEFETGLHHSVQTDIWRMMFETAKRLNVQVFATTHSWDCVEAFQEAAAEDQNEEAMLIRLQRKRDGSGIEAESYNERAMEIVTRQGIEVR